MEDFVRPGFWNQTKQNQIGCEWQLCQPTDCEHHPFLSFAAKLQFPGATYAGDPDYPFSSKFCLHTFLVPYLNVKNFFVGN